MKMKYENIIKQMTLAEKARMMSGKNTWETVDFEKYGIPSMTNVRRASRAEKAGRSRGSSWIKRQPSGDLFPDGSRRCKQLG